MNFCYHFINLEKYLISLFYLHGLLDEGESQLMILPRHCSCNAFSKECCALCLISFYCQYAQPFFKCKNAPCLLTEKVGFENIPFTKIRYLKKKTLFNWKLKMDCMKCDYFPKIWCSFCWKLIEKIYFSNLSEKREFCHSVEK